MRAKKITKECTVCSAKFDIPPCRDWREHECSSKCKADARKLRSIKLADSRRRNCERCGNSFVPKRSQIIADGHGRFCSISCSVKTFCKTDKFMISRAKSGVTYKEGVKSGRVIIRRGADHPSWVGGAKVKKRKASPGTFDMSISRLNELLILDANTGQIIWRRSGKRAGGNGKAGYRAVRVDGTLLQEHRVIFAMAHGHWPDAQIDHINCDPSDNRVANLREATPHQNSMNTRAHRDNKSGFKGVTAVGGVYRASIMVKGKTIKLGVFATPEDAHAEYAKQAVALRGEFARVR